MPEYEHQLIGTALRWTARPEWHERAACRDHPDPDLWHSGATGEPGRRINQRAKAVCRSCPVQQACLDEGLHQRHGIWGGLDERERRRLRRTPAVHRPVCGTVAGSDRHRYFNEHPCRACREARRIYQERRRNA